jgi:hypothetical protein
MKAGIRPWLCAAAAAGLLMSAGTRADEQFELRMVDGASPPRECLFLPGTCVPRLAIGVRRVQDPDHVRGELSLGLRLQPAASVAPTIHRPLYKPLYVYAEHRAGDGTEWYLLGTDYAVSEAATLKGALGWADGRELHMLTSRYAYHFKDPVELYQNDADAYAALESQSQRPPQRRPDLALVSERLQETHWDPPASDAIPPFVELRPERGPRLTDTTLTFPLVADNRLIHLGAIVGGPVDKDLLAQKDKQAKEKAGVEVLFVIDDTRSMEKFFPEVADFIGANLKGGDATALKVAVSWYNDREDDTKPIPLPYSVSPLQVVNDPTPVVDAVRKHLSKTIKGDGAQQRELLCEGLLAAIEGADFTPGAHAMVFVIGDFGDRSEEKTRLGLIDKIGAGMAARQLQAAFIQVGDVGQDKSFVDHAKEIGDRVVQGGGPAVKIATSDDKNLQKTIEKLQDEMDARRRRLEREIEDIRSRNPYSQPGAVMERRFKEAKIERRDFDERHMQFFAPACGWLYHPLNPDGDPQLRELVFISRPEATALVAMLAAVKNQVERQGTIDAAAAVDVLAKQLSRHPRAADAVRACWGAMPEADRTVGAFLRDAMGLRVRNPALYQRQGFKPLPATRKVGDMLERSKNWLAKEKGPGPERVWYDSWLVLP